MNKQLSVLAVIAILAIGLGVWLSELASKDRFAAVLLFEELQKHANQVDSVEITNAQGVLFSAQKLGDRWLATFDPELPVYPISQDKLAEFVETMMRTKLVEAKTSKPQNYVHLGLRPIDIDDSMASLVTLKTKKNSWQVLVGNKVTVGDGHYILKRSDSRSWRTDRSIKLPIDKFSWLKQPILPFQAQDISSISRVDSLDWQIARSASGDFQLIDMPKDKELKYAGILTSIVSSLTSLNFEQLLAVDKVTTDEDFAQSLKVLTRLEVSTTEGHLFQLVVSELGDKHFVRFSAINTNSTTSQLEYWQKWYYQISNFSGQLLIKTLDDFVVEQSTTTNITDNNSDIDKTTQQTVGEGDSPQ